MQTILVWDAWGMVSKVAAEGVDANCNQIFFTFGLLALIAIVHAAGIREPAARLGTSAIVATMDGACV